VPHHRPVTLTHAGGVVYRETQGVPTVLLVRARPEPHEWVLPKGHIEAGETPATAAAREVREEAGVEASAGTYVGVSDYCAPNGDTVRAGYFLMRFERNVSAHENREVRWCTFDEAAHLVTFENVREIIRTAARLLAAAADQSHR
jgi:8-oxo-dGTP pyrophosphatase MutT (NUDIX family)